MSLTVKVGGHRVAVQNALPQSEYSGARVWNKIDPSIEGKDSTWRKIAQHVLWVVSWPVVRLFAAFNDSAQETARNAAVSSFKSKPLQRRVVFKINNRTVGSHKPSKDLTAQERRSLRTVKTNITTWAKTVVAPSLKLDRPVKDILRIANWHLEDFTSSGSYYGLSADEKEEFMKLAEIAFAKEISQYLVRRIVRHNKVPGDINELFSNFDIHTTAISLRDALKSYTPKQIDNAVKALDARIKKDTSDAKEARDWREFIRPTKPRRAPAAPISEPSDSDPAPSGRASRSSSIGPEAASDIPRRRSPRLPRLDLSSAHSYAGDRESPRARTSRSNSVHSEASYRTQDNSAQSSRSVSRKNSAASISHPATPALFSRVSSRRNSREPIFFAGVPVEQLFRPRTNSDPKIFTNPNVPFNRYRFKPRSSSLGDLVNARPLVLPQAVSPISSVESSRRSSVVGNFPDPSPAVSRAATPPPRAEAVEQQPIVERPRALSQPNIARPEFRGRSRSLDGLGYPDEALPAEDEQEEQIDVAVPAFDEAMPALDSPRAASPVVDEASPVSSRKSSVGSARSQEEEIFEPLQEMPFPPTPVRSRSVSNASDASQGSAAGSVELHLPSDVGEDEEEAQQQPVIDTSVRIDLAVSQSQGWSGLAAVSQPGSSWSRLAQIGRAPVSSEGTSSAAIAQQAAEELLEQSEPASAPGTEPVTPALNPRPLHDFASRFASPIAPSATSVGRGPVDLFADDGFDQLFTSPNAPDQRAPRGQFFEEVQEEPWLISGLREVSADLDLPPALPAPVAAPAAPATPVKAKLKGNNSSQQSSPEAYLRSAMSGWGLGSVEAMHLAGPSSPQKKKPSLLQKFASKFDPFGRKRKPVGNRDLEQPLLKNNQE